MNPSDKQQDLFLFFIIPFIELFMLLLLLQSVAASYSFFLPATLFFFFFLSALLFLALYLYRRYYRKKQLSQAYKELSRLCDLQTAYRLRTEASRLELEQLRAGFSKQLSVICSCLQENRFQEAEDFTLQLSRRIAATKEYPFCPNAVINAVLTEKEQLCRSHSIAFQAELNIGGCDTLNKVHLCSIFTNLLDNAIHACDKIPETESRFIHVTAVQSGDYIHIKVTNSFHPGIKSQTQKLRSSSEEKGYIKEHGYGQKILADIAKQYSGQWNTICSDGVYEAALSLLLPSSAKK